MVMPFNKNEGCEKYINRENNPCTPRKRGRKRTDWKQFVNYKLKSRDRKFWKDILMGQNPLWVAVSLCMHVRKYMTSHSEYQ